MSGEYLQLTMTLADRACLLRRALINLALPALFIVGPITSLGLIAAIFGLPKALWYSAGPFIGLSLALFTILLRGEYRRLAARVYNRHRRSRRGVLPLNRCRLDHTQVR